MEGQTSSRCENAGKAGLPAGLQGPEGLDTQLGHTGSRLPSQEGEGLGWGQGLQAREPVQSAAPPPSSS